MFWGMHEVFRVPCFPVSATLCAFYPFMVQKSAVTGWELTFHTVRRKSFGP
jgi:hypothetical protein